MNITMIVQRQLPSNGASIERPHVLYLMGAGRSGSTFLDILLNAHPLALSIGEFSKFFDWYQNNRPCACTSPLRKCAFWSEVSSQFIRDEAGWGRREADRLDVEPRRQFLRLACHRIPEDLTRRYGETEARLLKIVSALGEKPIIIDSSKTGRFSAGRVLALSRYSGLTVKAIHLVRDVRGVVWSTVKKGRSAARDWGPATPWVRASHAVAAWLTANEVARRTCEALGPGSTIQVRYEDLVADPEHEIKRICEFIGIDSSVLVERLREAKPLLPGHSVAGNRLRLSEGIVLKPDLDWHERLPRAYRIGSWLLAHRAARKYGYRWDDSTGRHRNSLGRSDAAIDPASVSQE